LKREKGTGEETGEKRRIEREQEEELGEEEIEVQSKKIRKKKATGVDGIVGEAWLYSNDRLEKDSRIYSREYGKEKVFRKNGEISDNTKTQKEGHERCEK